MSREEVAAINSGKTRQRMDYHIPGFKQGCRAPRQLGEGEEYRGPSLFLRELAFEKKGYNHIWSPSWQRML